MTGYNVDPFSVTVMRLMGGYEWVPALLEERNYDLVPGSPGGLGANGVIARSYDPKNPTRRYIPVSLDSEKWPPFLPSVSNEDPPLLIEPKPDFSRDFTDGRFAVRVGDRSPIGTEWTGPEGKFRKVSVPTIAGVSVFWKEVK